MNVFEDSPPAIYGGPINAMLMFNMDVDDDCEVNRCDEKRSSKVFEHLSEISAFDQMQIAERFFSENLKETDPDRPRELLIDKIKKFGEDVDDGTFTQGTGVLNLEELVKSLGRIDPSHQRKSIFDQIQKVERMRYGAVILELDKFIGRESMLHIGKFQEMIYDPLLKAIKRDPSTIDNVPSVLEREEYIRSALTAARIIGSNNNFGIDIDYALDSNAKGAMEMWFSSTQFFLRGRGSRARALGNDDLAECNQIVAEAVRGVYEESGSIVDTILREKRSEGPALFARTNQAIGFAHFDKLLKPNPPTARTTEIVRAAYEAAMILAFAYGDDQTIVDWFAQPNVHLSKRGKPRSPAEALGAYHDFPEMFRRPDEVVKITVEDVVFNLTGVSGVSRNRKHDLASPVSQVLGLMP